MTKTIMSQMVKCGDCAQRAGCEIGQKNQPKDAAVLYDISTTPWTRAGCSVGRTSPPLDETWEACGNIVRDADSIEVCEVKLWRAQPSKDAKLIAATPELLAVAKDAGQIISNLLELFNHELDLSAQTEIGETLRDLTDAVRKAEGK